MPFIRLQARDGSRGLTITAIIKRELFSTMAKQIHILHLEDDPPDIELVKAVLNDAGLEYRITNAQTRDEFETALSRNGVDIVIADYKLPMYDGISALRLSMEFYPDIPFIFVSGTMGEEAAIEALTQGATDYVLKDNLSRLPSAVRRALEDAENRLERRQAREELQRSNDLLHTIIEAVPVAIIGLDLDGNVQSVWNPAAEKMLGWKKEEVMGQPLPSFPSDNKEEFREFRKEIQKGMNLEGLEVNRQKRDGTPIDYSIYASPLHDSQGHISGNIAALVDITEIKKAEKERLANLRFFESMDRINKAIQKADNLEQMMKNALDVVLSIFDCDRVYLQYPCDHRSETWSVPMESSKPDYEGFVFRDNLELPMQPSLAENLRILLATEGPVTFGPGGDYPQLKQPFKNYGVRSMIAMALYPKVTNAWQFGIHQCSSERIWTAEEARLFEAIGRRMSDALSSLLSFRDLRKNEEFLNKVIEHIPNMIFVKDARNLSFVRFNRAGEDLLGYRQEELIGKTVHDFFPEKKADQINQKDNQVLHSKELFDIPEETITTKDKKERILHTKKIPILDENGTPQYLLGISEDITEQKRAEQSIRKLSQAIEQSPVSIIITDVEGKIEFVNSQFTKTTGYTFSEVLGENPRILQSGETTSEEYKEFWDTISSGGVWQGVFHNRKKNGDLFWEHATVAPVRNSENVITHYVGVKEDITEQKRLEEQLRHTQKMEAIGQLAGGIAHDFNNMLGVIFGYAEMTLEKAARDDPLRKNIEAIREASLRSMEITRQLLAFARKQTVMPKVLDLNRTVEGMLKLLQRLIGEDIKLTWQPGPELWQIKIDPSQIDQILANLCVNARDAIPGVGKITIETKKAVFDDNYWTEREGFFPGEYVMLAVSDNGSGMDKRILEKIFEPFFTTKGLGRGTGLGLATVYGIVKQNAGFLNVYSEPGHGSTFRIYFPRYTVDGEQMERESGTDLPPGGDETILLVEDETEVLNMVKMMLEEFGYTVLTSSKPKEAILIATDKYIALDLLITDMIMPEMTGRELAENLTHLCPKLKCLFMSGYTGKAMDHQDLLKEGVNFIQKPFSKQELAARVRTVLDSK